MIFFSSMRKIKKKDIYFLQIFSPIFNRKNLLEISYYHNTLNSWELMDQLMEVCVMYYLLGVTRYVNVVMLCAFICFQIVISEEITGDYMK